MKLYGAWQRRRPRLIKIVWSPQASQSLFDIYISIGLNNPHAAERIHLRIEARVAELHRHPRMGPKRPDIRPNVRMLVERPYLILYELYPDNDTGSVETVEIVNIVDGRRNLSDLL